MCLPSGFVLTIASLNIMQQLRLNALVTCIVVLIEDDTLGATFAFMAHFATCVTALGTLSELTGNI